MSEAAKEPQTEAPSGGGGNKLVTLLTAVNLLLTAGMGGILFVSFQKEKSKTSVADISAGEPAGHGEAKSEGHGESGGHGEAKSEGHGESGGHGETKPEGGHGESGGHGEAKSEGHGESSGHGEGAKDTHASGDFSRMVTLDQFTVNLATPGSVTPQYVRVNISIEVPSGDAEGEVTQKMPQVRNAIIDLFNSKRPSDLANAEGRDYIKEEIKNALNSFMRSGKVKGVFFTNFAVSS